MPAASKTKAKTKKTATKATKTSKAKKKTTKTRSVAASKASKTRKTTSRITKTTAKRSTTNSTTTQPTPTKTYESLSFDRFVGMINEYFSLILMVSVAIMLGFYVGSLWTQNQLIKHGTVWGGIGIESGSGAATQQQAAKVTRRDYVRGANRPDVTLIVYSDYECPFCNRFHTTMNQVMDSHGDQVAWVLRDYPLDSHPLAQPTAEAAECVGSFFGEDAFWDYSDALFELKAAENLTSETMFSVLDDLGRDRQRIEDCVTSGRMADRVASDFESGQAVGISGTPGTLLVPRNGEPVVISGAISYDQLVEQIELHLE